MRRSRGLGSRFRCCAALVALAAALVAVPALGQPDSRVARAEGRLVDFDAESETIVVEEPGKRVLYRVQPEGSVITRTTVSIDDAPARLSDIPMDAPVVVYWVPDERDEASRCARKGQGRGGAVAAAE